MKPISEWTDAELWDYADDYDLGAAMQGLAAEVLRLRAELALLWERGNHNFTMAEQFKEMWGLALTLGEGWQARAEAAEENLAFAQQRAADNDLRARLGEDKIRALRAELALLRRQTKGPNVCEHNRFIEDCGRDHDDLRPTPWGDFS